MKFNHQNILNFKKNLHLQVQKKYPNLQIDCPLNNDIWAYSLIGDSGFFIEIGAGRSGNSTYVLEKYCNWSGILVEPISFFLEYLKILRPKSKVINKIVLDKDYENVNFFEFTYDPHYSSIDLSSILESIDTNKFEKINNKKFVNKLNIPSISLKNLLKNENVTKVDYLALDSQGSELQILQGLNFNSIRPKLISSESNSVTQFLISKDYVEVKNEFKDQKFKYEFYFIDKYANLI